MGMTMTQKILADHAGLESVEPGQLISAKLDMVLANDITGPVSISEFDKAGFDGVFDKSKVSLVMDHFTPNKDIKSAEQCKTCRTFAKRFGIDNYYDVGDMGIEHALLPEKGLVGAGDAIIGADSQKGRASSGYSAPNPVPASAPAPAPAKKLDLGTIALIGTAIGGISALVGGLLKALFDLGIWLPLGLLGIILLISGPSVVLASLKLRRRNLAPLLDANGWAINTRARVNIPFGATLTSLAKLPPGTVPSLQDPFKQKKSSWKRWVFLILLVLAAIMWWRGRFDNYLPERFQRFPAPPATESVEPPADGATPPTEVPSDAAPSA